MGAPPPVVSFKNATTASSSGTAASCSWATTMAQATSSIVSSMWGTKFSMEPVGSELPPSSTPSKATFASQPTTVTVSKRPPDPTSPSTWITRFDPSTAAWSSPSPRSVPRPVLYFQSYSPEHVADTPRTRTDATPGPSLDQLSVSKPRSVQTSVSTSNSTPEILSS